jgi:hypothetical protein
MSKKGLISLGATFAVVGGIYAANTIEIESEMSGTVTEYYNYSTNGNCAYHCQYELRGFVIDDKHAMLLGTPQLLAEGQFQSTRSIDLPSDGKPSYTLKLPPSIEDILAQGAELDEGALRIGDQVNVIYTNTIADILNFRTDNLNRVQELEVIEPVFDGFSID